MYQNLSNIWTLILFFEFLALYALRCKRIQLLHTCPPLVTKFQTLRLAYHCLLNNHSLNHILPMRYRRRTENNLDFHKHKTTGEFQSQWYLYFTLHFILDSLDPGFPSCGRGLLPRLPPEIQNSKVWVKDNTQNSNKNSNFEKWKLVESLKTNLFVDLNSAAWG